MSARAHSHGNYLPALDAALDLLAPDFGRQTQLFLVLLSDGAPSDHVSMPCAHGSYVWQPADAADPYGNGGYGGGYRRGGWRQKPKLQACPYSHDCRQQVQKGLMDDCVARVKRLGDLLGRDRVFVGTVAFGPPNENFRVLQEMAAALPRSSFQVRSTPRTRDVLLEE